MTISAEELRQAALDDLRKFVTMETREDGDIGAAEISEEYGVSKKQAWSLMEKAVESGEYIGLYVSGSNNKRIKVIRKIAE